MLPRSITVTLVAVVVVFFVGIAGAFAWDASRADVIADGVRIGPVDVSGLSREEARVRLQQRLIEPLNAPLVVSAMNETYPLSSREARIEADVEAMLDAAIERSRSGNVVARTWRAVRGEEIDATVTPQVRYSRGAVQRIVDRVRVAVSRKPVDAKIDFRPQSLVVRQSREGRTIDALKLRSDIERALVSAVEDRTLTVPVETVEPKLTAEELATKYPVVLAVDRGGFRISLFKRLKKEKVYPIALGRAGQETPSGLYKIQNKAVDPAWSVPNAPWAGSLAGTVVPSGAPNNPIKARWLGVYDGVGVHGTDARASIGTNASAGCIRMLIEDVKVLYDEVPVGTPIYIG